MITILFICKLKLKNARISVSYPTWLNTGGVGVLEKGNIIKDVNKRMHFDFCQNLSIKKTWQQPMHSYQPDFALFSMVNKPTRDVTWFKKDNFEAPSDISLSRVINKNIQLTANLQKLDNAFSAKNITKSLNPLRVVSLLANSLLDNKAYLTVGPNELPDDESFWHKFEELEEILFKDKKGTLERGLIKRFEKQPHLRDHTTFQFYLFNNIAMTANGRFLGIKPKCANCNNLIGEERPNKLKCHCSLEQRKIESFFYLISYILILHQVIFTTGESLVSFPLNVKFPLKQPLKI